MEEKYYKREVSLMDKRFYPRRSLDKHPENPEIFDSIVTEFVEKSDQEIINNTVATLKETGTK
ncbi:MAG: hypothetical protein LBQ89_08315 [Treponema sp.]|jgi:hypothetical protein|nr:hypothetical protein [Treponema sp.]